jgi:hypothetical protein
MTDKTISCSICNKLYSSNSSLSNHNRIAHGIRKHGIEKKYECRFCKKEYVFSQSRWKHEKTCKSKDNDEIEKIKEENEKLLKETIEKIKEENEKLLKKTIEKIKEENEKLLKETIEKIKEENEKNEEIITPL